MGILAIINLILMVLRGIPEFIKLVKLILELFKGSSPDQRESLKAKIAEAYSAYRTHNSKETLAKDLEGIAAHCKDGICSL